MKRVGYACITLGVMDCRYQSVTQKKATPQRLQEVIAHNLAVLETQLHYNVAHNITLFRISSDLIPFGGSSINTLDWRSLFAPQFARIRALIQQHNLRVSMHPGQYTVLNSTEEQVVARSIAELVYHADVLDLLTQDATHKIILHVGGAYQDHNASAQRFLDHFALLPQSVQRRLVLENDERSFNIAQVLKIANTLHIPAVFDNLHHACNPDATHSETEWIAKCKQTWKREDGPCKIHYSQQEPGKRMGAHSDTIDLEAFVAFVEALDEVDIMLEVKDKNLSAIKCANALAQGGIQRLEQEWSHYKYSVLEHSPKHYEALRALLNDKKAYPVRDFYRLLEAGLATPVQASHAINAAQHVFGYFKKDITPAQKQLFLAKVARYEQGKLSLRALKKHLAQLTRTHQQSYLRDSYYFEL